MKNYLKHLWRNNEWIIMTNILWIDLFVIIWQENYRLDT